MYRLNNSKILLILCFILFVVALLISFYKLKEKFQYDCQTECEHIGTPLGNCLCIKCCEKNPCEPLTNSILNFIDIGDTIDCKYLS